MAHLSSVRRPGGRLALAKLGGLQFAMLVAGLVLLGVILSILVMPISQAPGIR